MIVHSIKHKGIIQTLIGYMPTFYNGHDKVPINSTFARDHMDKSKFANFIEGVRLTFQKDDLVTYKQIPVIPRILPTHWKVNYLEELYQYAKWDNSLDEPAVVLVQCMDGNIVYKCPRILRKLTEEEKALVNLSNTPCKGTC